MYNMCSFLKCENKEMAKKGIERCSGDQKIEGLSCGAFPLSKNKGITADELQYCLDKNEDCSRYRKAEKLGKTIDRVEKIFRRK